MKSFADTLKEAIEKVTQGTTADEILNLQELLARSAEAEMGSEERSQKRFRAGMEDVYRKILGPQGIAKRHPGVASYTIAQLSPQLRSELERRILLNADLIKLNRREAIEQTKRRFSGWASSVPSDGSKTTDKRETAQAIRKSLSGLPFVERRVLIDQGQKLSAAVSDIVAVNGGAIAAVWKSHWHQANYDYRPAHKQFAVKSAKLPFVIRDNWAIKAGLMRLANSQYTDQIPQPAEEPFCRCWYEYIYSLRDLPAVMVTAKGRAMLEKRNNG
jgi:hypothetical protein